ncbi:hypothetical protein BJ138DRAFT_1147572 [Hygrophoropsis aurantiaca]|uniref:Uncharacterized protein n=1 Tax=Hygrophoropsis aurantiaca TaxID=72124 RepID=A0ACB8AHA6_9AGAM|nr:hypothetical protein BJ138DRAFT_1147572 [Hygrophoropsis aurantiaca]
MTAEIGIPAISSFTIYIPTSQGPWFLPLAILGLYGAKLGLHRILIFLFQRCCFVRTRTSSHVSLILEQTEKVPLAPSLPGCLDNLYSIEDPFGCPEYCERIPCSHALMPIDCRLFREHPQQKSELWHSRSGCVGWKLDPSKGDIWPVRFVDMTESTPNRRNANSVACDPAPAQGWHVYSYVLPSLHEPRPAIFLKLNIKENELSPIRGLAVDHTSDVALLQQWIPQRTCAQFYHALVPKICIGTVERRPTQSARRVGAHPSEQPRLDERWFPLFLVAVAHCVVRILVL